MKTSKTLIFIIMSLFIYQKSTAQTINWNTLGDTRHIITTSVGLDYSVSFSMGFAYQLKAKVPMLLTTNVSLPSGETFMDDFKAKIGAQALLLNKLNLRAAVIVNGIYRRYENPLVRLHNFGGELKTTFGYYKPKWFAGLEAGFDKAIVTHFKHSDIFKETIFTGVKDGWYKRSTGGNFSYGIQAGYSFKKSDFILNMGMVMTQDFSTTPAVPFYLSFGYNHKIN